MDNPIEFLGDAFQGDIEIAGKRIPKIALIAGGGALIVVLILLSRRGGSGGSVSSGGLSADAGLGGGFSGSVGGSDQSTDEFLGGSLSDISEQFSQQLADQSSTLTDLINQSSQQNADSLASQLNDVYSQIAANGGGTVPIYSDQVQSLPVDYGLGSFPVDNGISSYPDTNVLSLPVKSPTPIPSVGNTGFNGANIKPSNPKSPLAKLGAALPKSKSGADKVAKLSTGKKTQSLIPSAITNFGKTNPFKPAASPVASGKKPTIPSPIPNKIQKPTSALNVKPTASGKKPAIIPPTIKTGMVNKPAGSNGPQASAKKPAPISSQKSGGYKPVASPKTSAYKPPVQNPIAVPLPYSFLKSGSLYGSKIISPKPKSSSSKGK